VYPTSQAYKDNIYQSSRVFKSKISLKIVDPLVDDRINSTFFTITTQNAPSLDNNNFELVDGIRSSTQNYVTFCQNKIKLGTNFSFLENTANDRGHLGLLANNTSDVSKNYSANKPTFTIEAITAQWATLPFLGGCAVNFDTTNSEYAEEFRVVITNSLNSTETITITGNTTSFKQIPFTARNVKRIDYIIDKWSKPNTRARIQQIDLGLVLAYENDKLMNLNLTEEADLHLGTLPNSLLSFELYNASLEWDPLDSNNTFASLKQNQKIELSIGLQINGNVEYIPVGVYFLREWTAKPKELTARFIAGGVLSKLESTPYADKTSSGTVTLQSIAETIFSSAKITNYYIDPALSLSSNHIKGFARGKNARDVLHYLCMLKNIKLRVTRQNQIRLEVNYDTIISDTITTSTQREDVDIETALNPYKVIVYHYHHIDELANPTTYTIPNAVEGITATVDSNTFIDTQTHALTVATALGTRLNQWRRKFIINFIGNPALELLDLVAVQNQYTKSTNIHLTKLELSYNGFLSARAEGWAQV
jgi:hypothetical protein